MGQNFGGTRRIALLACFSASAVAVGLMESYFPLPFPGMRLGLANIFPLLALILFGPSGALAVAFVKLFLTYFLSGNFFGAVCGASGLLCSLPLTIFLYQKFSAVLSVPAISVASAFAFNTGQVCAVAAMTGEPRIFAYLPMLLLFAAFTGCAVGVTAENLSGRIRGVR
jgi:heptaprenyl diphosphate synthase